MKMRWLDRLFAALGGRPVGPACTHPEYAREGRVELLPEQDAVRYYETCLNCGAVFDD
jgi:hypothetical protein